MRNLVRLRGIVPGGEEFNVSVELLRISARLSTCLNPKGWSRCEMKVAGELQLRF